MTNIKYADPSYTDTNATDDDRVMLRTGAGGDARAPLVQPKGYIDGLKMVYVSATQIQITTGAAYVPGPKRIAELTAAITLTPTLAASTWYHLYLTVAGATVGVEAVTTAPAAPYAGTARAKTGDTSRRYIGSFRTNASSQVYDFDHNWQKGEVMYRLPGTLFRVLSNGSATTATTVACATAIPVTSKSVYGRVLNLSTSANLIVGPGDAAITTNDYFLGVSFGGQAVVAFLPTDSSQQLRYLMSAAQSGAYIDAYGFAYER
ncbi:hypothetical protein [Stenotrophomonas sp. 59]|uniref:hypothetical protein n=1 Tax=Stenotrophomonas sp. 59 TaxID=3051120 RepID=UPI00256EB3A9|nr:hypothetical protein [Stenotrophomonas sp. 59]